MSKLSNGAKQGIIEEALSGNGVSIRSIARKYNIGASTLHKWIKKYRENDITYIPAKYLSKQSIRYFFNLIALLFKILCFF